MNHNEAEAELLKERAQILRDYKRDLDRIYSDTNPIIQKPSKEDEQE